MASIRIKRGASGKREIVTANLGGSYTSVNNAGTLQSVSSLLGANLKSSLLEGLLEEKSNAQIHAVYKDIYLHDPIAGAAIDLKSSLPWSDFTLSGVPDNLAQTYMDNIERLNMMALHQELSVDYMVTGAFVGTLSYDSSVKGFTDIIPYNFADCDVTSVPLYSEDPIIRYSIPDELRKFATDNSEEARRIQKKIPPGILKHFQSSKQVDLSPLTTLYVPRTTTTTQQVGISYLRRIVPIYLLERVLYRGTVTEATRRQRATLHITAGDMDWTPSEEDLNTLVALFQSSESDPISSVVATRSGISTTDVRPGGDFWKYTDVVDQLGAIKMRALGINEGFLSGDSSYNTMDKALSVFIEDLRAMRDRIARQVYTNKLFPLIAQLNDFVKKDGKTKETSAYVQADMITALNNSNRYELPQIQWHKQLKPEADNDYLDVLNTLTEKGVPVPVRMWAAAGGLNLDKVMAELDDDKKVRESIRKATGSDMGEELSGLNILTRDYGETAEVCSFGNDGKKHWVHNQRALNEKINAQIASSLTRIADHLDRKEKANASSS